MVGELGRVDLDADRRLLLAADHHLGDARNLRNLLGQNVVGIVVDRGQRQRIGACREDHDRRLRRIGLAVGRRRRKSGRQLPTGGGNGRLHVLRRGVDVAVEVELQRDRRLAQRAGRGHLRDPGNLPELALERGRNGGGHGIGAGAGELGGNGDGGKVDLRKRRHRQQRKGDDAHECQRRHEQGRRDRSADERLGDAHGASPLPRRHSGRARIDPRTGLQAVLAVHDHPIARREPAVDDRDRRPAWVRDRSGASRPYPRAGRPRHKAHADRAARRPREP